MSKKITKKKRTTKNLSNKKKELFYVGVRNAVDFRKSVLESTKEFVQVLQMYNDYDKLRSDMTIKVEKLQKDVKKIKNINSRLKRLLPETGLRAELLKKKQTKQKKSKKQGCKSYSSNFFWCSCFHYCCSWWKGDTGREDKDINKQAGAKRPLWYMDFAE